MAGKKDLSQPTQPQPLNKKSNGTVNVVIRKPAKRPYKPKVRTGCITCKIRRVKCDENKPSCLRCSSTGRKCDGFAPPPQPLLTFEISADARERRSFHYFRERTTLEICSYDASRFWSRLVLQAGYVKEPVRHALVAVGSFHEGLASDGVARRDEQMRFTLEQYNKAIVALRKDAKSLSVEDVLMSCIIFVFFENLQGHFTTALKHLDSGLKILAEWRSRRSCDKKMASAVIEEELGGILDTLHVQASVLLPEIRSKARKEYSDFLPDSLANLQEAHHYFYQLVHWTCENLELASNPQNPLGIRDSFIPPKCAARFIEYHSLMERDILGTIEMRNMTHQEQIATRLGVLHLSVQYHIVIIMLRCLPFKTEMVFDQQIQHFQAILQNIRDFISLSASPDFDFPSATKTSGFDFFVIPALSMVGCRCRDPTLRREAISLMRSNHWREDIWDSLDASSVAEQMMMAEERGRNDVKSCYDIPESDRLHLIGCTSFEWSESRQRLDLLPHNTFDPEWVRLTYNRSNWDPSRDGLEEMWVHRRASSRSSSSSFSSTTAQASSSLSTKSNAMDNYNVPTSFPRDVDGLFPQVVAEDSSLFSLLNTGHAARFMGRFHANNMFAAAEHTRATTDGEDDFVTLAGEFTEYLATERRYYDWPC